MTPGGTETTSHCSSVISCSPSSPQYTAHRPESGMKTSMVVCACSAAPLPDRACTSVRLKSRASVMAGPREASSVTPRPMTLKMSRSWPGMRLSTNAWRLGLSSLNRATRWSISSREICTVLMDTSWFALRSRRAEELRQRAQGLGNPRAVPGERLAVHEVEAARAYGRHVAVGGEVLHVGPAESERLVGEHEHLRRPLGDGC